MRIAYVDANVRYLNRTRNDFIRALSLSGEVRYIGPGFSEGDSSVELSSLICTTGAQVDVIVTTPHVAHGYAFADWSAKRIARLYRNSFAFTFDDRRLRELVALNRVMADATIPRALVLLEADYYNFTQDDITAFRRVSDMILGFGPETWARRSELPNLGPEAFANRANDVWADFLESHKEKVSSMHHIIGDDEFCAVPLGERRVQWSVMGASYRARQVAIARLRAAGLSPIVSSPARKLLAGLKKLHLLRGETRWSLGLIQGGFRRGLWNSRYSYTCGSGLEMPIRKFFEIPAAGAVLVCRPFRGARNLGFKAGENFVACEPEDVVEAHRWLEANHDKAQAIADAGRKLVMDKHSVAARATQIRMALEALVSSKGVGRWRDGLYRIVAPDAARGAAP